MRSRTTSRRAPFRRVFGRQRPPIPRGAWSRPSVRRGSRVASRQRSEARSPAQPRAGRRAGRRSRSVAKRGRTLLCRHPRRGRRSARAEDTARAVPWPGDGAGHPLAADEDLVRARLRRADTRTAARMAGDCERRPRAHPGTDGLGQDARCVPGRHRPAQRDARGRPAPSLRLAAQGAELRHRAEPAKPARRARLEALGRGAHGGHACGGAAPNAADPSRHPHHHARVAVPAPHLAGTRDASRDRDRDPRRGARSRRHEARRASGAVARATRAPGRRSLPAPRALGDPAADGGDRSVRRRIGPRDPARRRGRPQGAGPPGRRSGRGHARAAVDGRALCPAARGRGRDGRWRRALEPVDLAVDLPRDPRPRQSSTARRSSS